MHSYSSRGPQAATLLPPITTQTITGASLAHRQLDKRQRAVLAADMLDGLVTFTPSAKQLADIFDVSVPYINVARKLSAGKRAAILKGWDPVSFADLMNPPPRQLSLLGPVIIWSLVARYSVDWGSWALVGFLENEKAGRSSARPGGVILGFG